MQGTFTTRLVTAKIEVHTLFRFGLYQMTETPNKKMSSNRYCFITHERSLKAKSIQYNNRVSICVNDQAPQFSFVTIHGIRKICYHKQNELFKQAVRIVGRYTGKSNRKVYDKRNSTKDAVLVQIKPIKIIAEKDVAE